MRMNSCARLGAALVALLVVVGCGGNDVTVKVGSLISAAAARRTAQGLRSVPSDVSPSGSDYAFAKVDGIKLTLTKLQALTTGNEETILEWSGGNEVEIAPGAANSIAITETASINAGTYRGMKVRYNNSYGLKAFCQTNSHLVYTTAAGIVKTTTIGATMPADYGYYAYPFAELTTSTSATGGNPETMAETSISFTITDGAAPSIAILFDPSYLVSCYDGDSTTGGGNSNALSPFVWTNNNGLTTQDFFPHASPNFGMGYVPVFVWISTDASETAPTAEAYASSLTLSNLTAPINFANVDVTTFAFKSDGTILDSRTRIPASGNSGTLAQFSNTFALASGVHSFYNGEWNCETGYTNCAVIKDRAVSAFARTSNYTSTVTASYGDGPACGGTAYFPGHETDWGNRIRACTGTTAPLYFKQVPR